MKYSPLLILSLACTLLSGCAAIVKGWKSSVRLETPPQTDVRNYSGYDVDEVPGAGGRVLELTAGEEYLVEYQVGEHRDSTLLLRRLNWLYLCGDMFMAFPIGLTVDLNGPAYEFDKEFIAFRPPPDSLMDSTSRQYLNIYALDGLEGYTRRSLGLVVMGHLGVKYPFNQVPIFGNNYGVGIGYRLLKPFVLMGYYGNSGLMDYAPGDEPIYMEAGVTTFALEGRYYLTRSLYAAGGLEYLFIAADSMWLTSRPQWQRIRGFADRMPGASVGVGISFPGFFFELRQHWGFEQLRIRERVTTPVSNFAMRFGVNVEF